MNIFVTSTDPWECARNLDDKRVGKLLMEANQMLSMLDIGLGAAVLAGERPKPGFWGHPCSMWVRRSSVHSSWLYEHARALAAEWEHRFGFTHASARHLPHRRELIGGNFVHDARPGEFVNCARNKEKGIDFTHVPDVPMAYKLYLRERWKTDTKPVRFTNRDEPEWKGK